MNLPPRLRTTLIRTLLLIGFLGLLAFVVLLGRRVGLGEWALILALFAIVIGVESVRYVVRQFLQGLRGEGKYRN